MTTIQNMFTAFREGGVFMYFILCFGLLTLGFIAERFQALYKRIKPVPADFRANVLANLSRGDFKGAESYVQAAASDTSLGRITLSAIRLRASACGDDELQARMDDMLSKEISSTDRRTGFLGMYGNVATLLGLLGTIAGMIHSFAAVASASPVDRATMLSKGISEAMNCTAFGLIVAIPALVAYAIFQNRTDKIVTTLTESTSEIFHDLLFLSDSQSAEKSSAPEISRGNTIHKNAPSMTV